MRMPIKTLLAVAALTGAVAGAHAAEDTGTPGAGKWEINLNVSGERSAAGWEYVVPDTEFNYGLGERAQLTFALPYIVRRDKGAQQQSGVGSTTAGVKWRLFEREETGLSLALFPALTWNLSGSANRRGLAEAGRSLALPLIAGVEVGENAIFAEAGRVLVEEGPNEWLAGIRVTRQCLATVECRVEVEHNVVPRQAGHTLASVGFKWRVAEDLVIQGSIGRDIGPSREEKHELAFMFGIQLLR